MWEGLHAATIQDINKGKWLLKDASRSYNDEELTDVRIVLKVNLRQIKFSSVDMNKETV